MLAALATSSMSNTHVTHNRIQHHQRTVLPGYRSYIAILRQLRDSKLFCRLHCFRKLVNVGTLPLCAGGLSPALASQDCERALYPITCAKLLTEAVWNSRPRQRFAFACTYHTQTWAQDIMTANTSSQQGLCTALSNITAKGVTGAYQHRQ